ncbi:MAG: DUF1329 domain-containing protein [Gammaproteobacteria bacterium]
MGPEHTGELNSTHADSHSNHSRWHSLSSRPHDNSLYSITRRSSPRKPLAFAIILALTASAVQAKVSQEEAAMLGKTLTPMGAKMAGNPDKTIPAWTGGITSLPPNYSPDQHPVDPFKSDTPLFTIDSNNYTQYQDKLSPGQVALFQTYPNWKMKIYPTRRSASYPQYVYDATRRNATNSTLNESGYGVKNAIVGTPFPIPKSPIEMIYNHTMRWRSERVNREITQAVPTVGGAYTPVTFKESILFDYNSKTATPEQIDQSNILFHFKQEVTSPARLAGSILLVHETLDQQREPRRAWIYNVGQRRVRRAPNVSYDNPGTASDGMRTADNFDMFNGSPDRYEWKYVGKKELYIPYNSYALLDSKLSYDDILLPGHINPEHTRYELHRVWQIEGTLKKGINHLYSKRVFFLDEDTWQIAIADHYDGRNKLWRVAEAHMINFYQIPNPWLTLEVLYDIQARRYLALGLTNNKPPYDFNPPLTERDFLPSSLRRQGLR